MAAPMRSGTGEALDELNSAEADRRKLQQAFAALDENARLQAFGFDGWQAWAIIKPRLWYIALMRSKGQPPALPSAGAALSRVLTGFAQLALNIAAPKPAVMALLYSERWVRLPEGGSLHPHLGRLADAGSSLRGVSAWSNRKTDQFFLERGRLSSPAVVGVAAALALFVARNRKLAALADELAAEISPMLPMLPRAGLAKAIAGHLARFRLRRAIWRTLIRRAGAQALAFTDGGSKAAEIAAAKDLALPAIEIQHGIVSTHEPEFAWTSAHRKMLSLPVPDHFVLFGSSWRDALAARGYWNAADLHLAAPPALAPFRQLAMAKVRTADAPLTILFPTEEFLRGTAIAFWQELLSRAAGQDEVRWRLRIKLHPGERTAAAEYEALVSQFPERCAFVPSEVEAFDELAVADVVVGYTSTMLVEAVALGIPTVALRGGTVPDGFAATFGFPELADAMVETERPADLLMLLNQAQDDGYHRAWRARTQASSGRVFSWDAPDVVQVVKKLLSGNIVGPTPR